jgi:hypothetical protein
MPRLALAATFGLGAAGAPAAPDAAQLADLAGVLATDEIGGHMVAFCEDKSPATAAAVRQAWQDWRTRFDVASVRAQIERAAPGVLQRQRSPRAAIMAKMAQEGAPDATCGNLAQAWAGSVQMDMHKRHPRAYDADGRAVPLAATGRQGEPQAAGQSGQGGQGRTDVPADRAAPPAGAVWLSPAQLHVMVQRGRKAPSNQDRLLAAGLTGRLYIKGQVARRRDSFHLEQVQGPFRSRLTVATGIDLSAHEGRTVVVSGTLDELPTSLAFLRQTRLVTDPSGLVPSSEPVEPGLYRAAVPAEQVTAAPGKGIAPSQLQAVFMWTRSGSQFEEHAWLLLRDGLAYDRGGTPPADLDLARSRELEPQHWRRWRPAGSGRIEWQRQDDHGKPAGGWETTAGSMAEPWPAGATLEGSYTSQRFHGNLTFGGTYQSSTIRFARDGRFEWSRFSQSGTGAVQSAQGVSIGSTRHSDGSGTRASLGAAAPGVEGPTAAPGVVVAGRGRKDDGAEQRGRYRLDGHALELHYDSGRIERRLSFPLAWSRPAVFIGDSIFTAPEKK